MRDELALLNETSRVVNFSLRSSSTGQLLTGKVAGDFTGVRHVAGGTSTALSFSVGTAGDPYSSGKICPMGDGTYDWHVPNAMFTALGQSRATINCSGALDVVFDFQVGAVDRNTEAFNAATPTHIVDTETIIVANITAIESSLAANIDANETKIDTVIARIPVALDGGRMIVKAEVVTGTVTLAAAQPNYAPAVAGNAMTLTSGERTAIANEVETQIIDDTDSEKVLQAIIDKIAAANPSLEDLTLAAIASAVRTELATELARIDLAISTRSSQSTVDVIDDFVDTEINTLLTRIAGVMRTAADDVLAETAQTAAVRSGLALTSDLQTAATAALTAYDPPTNAEMVTRTLATADYATSANQTTILNRLGSFTGTGVNTVLGFFKSLMSKSASTPSDVGGTFSAATDSAEAISEAVDGVTVNIDYSEMRTELGLAAADLDDQLDALLVAINADETGQYVIRFTVKNGDGDALPYCDVNITASNTGDSIELVASGTTNISGNVEFKLNPGTYYIWRNKSSYEFTDPLTLVIDNDGEATVS